MKNQEETGWMESIEWLDSHSIDGWIAKEKLDNKPTMIQTIGRVMLESEDAITVVSTMTEKEDQFSCVMIIPKCSILSRAKLCVKPNE